MTRGRSTSKRILKSGLLAAAVVALIAAPAAADDKKVALFPIDVTAASEHVGWMSTALPLHLAEFLASRGLVAEVLAPGAPGSPISLEDDDLRVWVPGSDFSVGVTGKLREASGSLRLTGSIFTNTGKIFAYSFTGKTSDMGSFILDPAYLVAEAVLLEPMVKFSGLRSAPPRALLNRNEISFGNSLTPEEIRQSETLYQSAIRVDPNNADAYYQLGYLYGQAKRWDLSIRNLEEAVRKSPKHLRYHTALGLAYFLNGRPDDAQGTFLQGTVIDDKSAEALYNLHFIFRENGDTKKAEETLERARNIDPAYPLLHFGQAIILIDREEPAEAKAQFEALLNDTPDLSIAHNNLGVLQLLEGDAAAAQKSFQRAMAADSGNALALTNLAVTQINEGKIPEAVKNLDKALMIDPATLNATLNLGCASLVKGDLARAAVAFAAVLAKNPVDGYALVNLGVSTYLKGNTAAGIGFLQKAARQSELRAMASYNLGVIYQTLGKKDDALNYYLAARAIPPIPQAHLNLGIIYTDLGQDQKALNEYLKTLSLMPETTAVYLNLGLIYFRMGYTELALETVKKSTLVSFNDPTAYLFLGRLVEKFDRYRALEYYKAFGENVSRDMNRGPIWKDAIEAKINSLN